MTGVLIPVLLSIAYAGLVVGGWSRLHGGFASLSDLAGLFDTRALLLAGWLHYLAFDMLIGAWEVREAKRQGMAHWTDGTMAPHTTNFPSTVVRKASAASG